VKLVAGDKKQLTCLDFTNILEPALCFLGYFGLKSTRLVLTHLWLVFGLGPYCLASFNTSVVCLLFLSVASLFIDGERDGVQHKCFQTQMCYCNIFLRFANGC